jgi:hypothetical protein
VLVTCQGIHNWERSLRTLLHSTCLNEWYRSTVCRCFSQRCMGASTRNSECSVRYRAVRRYAHQQLQNCCRPIKVSRNLFKDELGYVGVRCVPEGLLSHPAAHTRVPYEMRRAAETPPRYLKVVF